MQQYIKAEKLLEQNNIACHALPTPREIDISCGQCLLVVASQQAKTIRLLADNKVRWSKLFSRTAVGQTYLYEKITEHGGSRGTNIDN